MSPAEMQAAGAGSNLASWTPLLVLLTIYGLIVVALAVFGRPRRAASGALDTWVARSSGGLTAVTGLPGWACAAAGTSLFGLLVAGVGFYSDVAWHIALGRDEDLFTAPHTAIVVGLGMLLLGAVLGVLFATFDRVDVGRRVGALTVPWSCIPLGALGVAALMGFPLDELWHAEYGIDVTMWSPTHLLMIVGASLSGLASWLIFAEAGVTPRTSRWGRVVHVVAAWLTLQGLAAVQGEFSFGVPQFQQLYHPVLVLLAGAAALVATRIVLGPWWALGITTFNTLLMGVSLTGGDGSPVPTREGGLYLTSALAVELVAWRFGVGTTGRQRLRFALLAGAGVATLGLAGEFAWNAGARQPWTSALLPDAFLVGGLVALGAAVLGAGLGRAVAREGPGLRQPRWAVSAAAVAVLVGLALPLPRDVGDVVGQLELRSTGVEDEVIPRVTLTPADAAEGARWFQAMSWQGGELRLAEMVEIAPGVYEADGPIPIFGRGKALVRLHRGSEMMAIPIRLPDDPEIGEPEVPAVDRTVAFTSETSFLLREQTPGGAILAVIIYALLAGVATIWAASFALAARRIAGGGSAPARDDRPLVRT